MFHIGCPLFFVWVELDYGAMHTGQPVAILGTVTVQAKYGEQLLQLSVHVVEGDGPNLLGRDWLGKLKINLANIKFILWYPQTN